MFNLRRLAKVCPDFVTVHGALKAVQEERWANQLPKSGVRKNEEWQPNDAELVAQRLAPSRTVEDEDTIAPLPTQSTFGRGNSRGIRAQSAPLGNTAARSVAIRSSQHTTAQAGSPTRTPVRLSRSPSVEIGRKVPALVIPHSPFTSPYPDSRWSSVAASRRSSFDEPAAKRLKTDARDAAVLENDSASDPHPLHDDEDDDDGGGNDENANWNLPDDDAPSHDEPNNSVEVDDEAPQHDEPTDSVEANNDAPLHDGHTNPVNARMSTELPGLHKAMSESRDCTGAKDEVGVDDKVKIENSRSTSSKALPHVVDLRSTEEEHEVKPDEDVVLATNALHSLRDQSWINDVAIDLVLQGLSVHSDQHHVVTSCLVRPDEPTARTGKRYGPNVEGCDMVIVPLCHGRSHWTIGVIHPQSGCVEVFDPLHHDKYIDASEEALCVFASNIACKTPLSFRVAPEVLRQHDSHNCGIYVLVFAVCRMLGVLVPRTTCPSVWRDVFSATIAATSVPKWTHQFATFAIASSEVTHSASVSAKNDPIAVLEAVLQRASESLPIYKALMASVARRQSEIETAEVIEKIATSPAAGKSQGQEWAEARERLGNWCQHLADMPRIPGSDSLLARMKEQHAQYNRRAVHARFLEAMKDCVKGMMPECRRLHSEASAQLADYRKHIGDMLATAQAKLGET